MPGPEGPPKDALTQSAALRPSGDGHHLSLQAEAAGEAIRPGPFQVFDAGARRWLPG